MFGIVRGSTEGWYPNLEGVRDHVQLLQGDLLDQMTLLDAITTADPDELYNLAATSFVPVSWRQPVMTAQFTAVGVTSMLEAVRITKPGLRIYQASTSEIFGATTESPQTESTPFFAAQPLRGGQALRAPDGGAPTASATACTPARGSSTTTSRRGAGPSS